MEKNRGKITVLISTSTHGKVKRIAEKYNMPLETLIDAIIRKFIKRQERKENANKA